MNQKNPQKELQHNNNSSQDQKELLEIHKAVAQAWHGHFTNAKEATVEFDARRRNFQSVPSRFKLETLKVVNDGEVVDRANKWDFAHSLWDSYEIVTISKRLEAGLVLDYDFDHLHKLYEKNRRMFKRRKESKNSLRNLFNMNSSRRFNDAHVSQPKTK